MVKIAKMRKVKAFSLMEIMVALSIIIALGSGAVMATGHLTRMAANNAAKSGAAAIAVAINQYRMEMGQYPGGMSVLTTKVNSSGGKGKGPWLSGSSLVDPWNNTYNYSYDEDEQRFAVWSSGPDKVNNSSSLSKVISNNGVFLNDDIGFLSR